ncbi:hypothetical protein [Rubrobacter aplysinae]|uniref:hypothetical protein n=1 Tax=Rubrobacter aplysinae TaxID=909625 RepID=UPI00064C134A|nr:hypothetical protein [Rubrobacter aplysinae]
MQDVSRELSAFFDDRYPGHARTISTAVELPNGWVLAMSFERVRDNRGGAHTVYYATRVKNRVLLGEERAHSGNHREVARPDYPRAAQQIEKWYRALRKEVG